MRDSVTGPLKDFTDREAELGAYDAMWEAGQRRIICFDGLSGIGKSMLLQYLDRQHDPGRSAALISLDNQRLHAGYEFLAELSVMLRGRLAGLDWRRYERAQRQADEESARLRSLPEISIRQEQIARGHAAYISNTPQTASIGVDVLAEQLARQAAEHERRSRSRLLAVLCEVLAPAQPFVVLVDSYEAAAHSADRGFADWFSQEFLPLIERLVPAARVVVAGREDVPDGFARPTTIGQWNRADSDVFLRRRQVTDTELAGAVFALCRGVPLVTSLAADVWAYGVAVGQPVTPRELLEATRERAAVKWLMDQLYKRLPDGLGEVVMVAVRLRTYQPDLIGHLLGGTDRFDADAEARLASLSFSRQLPGGGLQAHDLVREVENSWFRRRPEQYRHFHLMAAGYCEKAGDLKGFLYHGIAGAEESFAQRWFAAAEGHRLALRLADVEGLIGLLTAPERLPYLQPGTLGLLRLEQALLAKSYTHIGPMTDQPASHRLTQTESLLRESHAFFQQARSVWGIATASHALGDLQVRTDRLADAEQSYGKALDLYRQIDDRLGEARTLQALGELHMRNARLTNAQETYDRALHLYRQLKDHLGEANTLKELGDLHAYTNPLADAREAYGRALDLYRRLGVRLGEASVLKALGDLQARVGRLSDAKRSYDKALVLYQQIEDRLGEANTLQAEGDLQALTDRPSEAQETYGQALDLYRQIGHRFGEANALQALGDLQVRTGMLAVAEQFYCQALRLCQQTGDHLTEANTLRGLGDLQALTDRLSEAQETYGQAQDLYRQIEDCSGEANALQALGDLQVRTGMLADAEQFYRQALRLCQQTEDHLTEANALSRLGLMQMHTDRLADAEQSYRQALPLYQRAENPGGEAHALQMLGDLQVRTDRLADAEQSYRQALPLYQQVEDLINEANTLQSLGKLYSVSGEESQAEDMFSLALERFESIGDRYSVAATLVYRGRDRAARHHPDSFQDWRQALAISVTVDLPLFGRVASTVVADALQLLLSDTADSYLMTGLAQTTDKSDLEHRPLTSEHDLALATTLAGLTVIRDLAAVKVSGPPDPAPRSRLNCAAREFDDETDRAFGLAVAARQILLQADAKAATNPLAILAATWVTTPDWQESETFLAAHAELLSEEGQAALVELTQVSEDDTVTLYANLLAVAWHDGVAAAYAQLRAELAAAPPISE